MNRWITRNVDKLAVVGAAILVAGLSFGAGSDTGQVAKPPAGQTQPTTQKTGNTAMLTATNQQGIIHHADDTNFDDLVVGADVPVLVDFYADWCGPCRMIAPLLEELARETTDAKIVKVNVDLAPSWPHATASPPSPA
jgi:thiol-disulfide isomerase/thioredoxin